MNHEAERLLHQVTPPSLPPELRERVLRAVDEELRAGEAAGPRPPRARSRWRPGPGLAAASVLLTSLLLNYLANSALNRRLGAVLGPRPVPRQAAEIAAEIAALTDSRTGQWALERLAPRDVHQDETRSYPLRLRRLIDDLAADSQDFSDETPQKDAQVDRDRSGFLGRDSPGAQRVLRLEHGNRA